MDDQIAEEKPLAPSITLTEKTLEYLKSAAGWTKFLAILGFVACGLMASGGLLATIVFSFVGNEMDMMPFPPVILGLLYLVLAGVYFLPAFYMYNFSSKTQQAITLFSTGHMEEAVKNIKSYFKFVGIFVIVMISLYIVAIIGMILSFAFFQDGIMEWQQQSIIQ